MAQGFVSKALTLTAAALALAAAVVAQNASQNSKQTSATKRKNPPPKAKVWTEDNIGSVRTPADNFQELKDSQASLHEASAKQQAAPAETTTTPNQPKVKPPLLSDPKTTADADKMIAWEDRDIAAQAETVDRVQRQLDQAPPEDRPRLQKLLDQSKQVLAETKAERQGLVEQKKDLQKKPANPNRPN